MYWTTDFKKSLSTSNLTSPKQFLLLQPNPSVRLDVIKDLNRKPHQKIRVSALRTSILKLRDDREATLARRRRYVLPRSTLHTCGAHRTSFWLQLIPAGLYVGTDEQLYRPRPSSNRDCKTETETITSIYTRTDYRFFHPEFEEIEQVQSFLLEVNITRFERRVGSSYKPIWVWRRRVWDP